jgi:hypothetical protein
MLDYSYQETNEEDEMSRKRTQELLRAARVFNIHGLVRIAAAAERDVVGVYVAYSGMHGWGAPQWSVIRPGYQTDPDAHWQDRGNKTFIVRHPVRDNKVQAREQAIEWAHERYDYPPDIWVPSPFSSNEWLPKIVLDAALDAVRAGAALSKQDGSVVLPPN